MTPREVAARRAHTAASDVAYMAVLLERALRDLPERVPLVAAELRESMAALEAALLARFEASIAEVEG